MGDHITQEALIKKIMGKDGFLLFSNHHHKGYQWESINDYTHPTLMYNEGRGKEFLSKYNPDKISKNKILHKIETNIHQTLGKVNTSKLTKNLSDEDINELVVYGAQLIARFEAPRAIEKHNKDHQIDGSHYNDVLHSLLNISELIFKHPRTHWMNIVNSDPIIHNIQYENFNNDRRKNISVVSLKCDPEHIILSDAPAIYSTSMLVYPSASDELLSIRIKNNHTDMMFDKLLDDRAWWASSILSKSELYLIAHKNLSTDILDEIKNYYESGHGALHII